MEKEVKEGDGEGGRRVLGNRKKKNRKEVENPAKTGSKPPKTYLLTNCQSDEPAVTSGEKWNGRHIIVVTPPALRFSPNTKIVDRV